MDKAVNAIGRYIKKHMDDNRPMSINAVSRYALLGRDKVDGERDRESDKKWSRVLRKAYEQERAEEVTKRFLEEFAEVKKHQLTKDDISNIGDEYRQLFGEQKDEISDILANGNHTEDMTNRFEEIDAHLDKVKNELLDNMVMAAEKPPEFETEQVMIEETGMIIEISKRG
jgi:hypothetical protein